MKIQITPTIVIDNTNEQCWIVKVKKIQKGKARWENSAYCVHLDSAINHVVNLRSQLSTSIHHSIDDAVAEIRSIWRETKEAAEVAS